MGRYRSASYLGSEIRCTCARCGKPLRYGDASGESQIYSPAKGYELCERCWLEEDVEIEAAGTNQMPDKVAEYERNTAGSD